MKEVLIDTADIDSKCFSYHAPPQIKQMINNIDYRNVTDIWDKPTEDAHCDSILSFYMYDVMKDFFIL